MQLVGCTVQRAAAESSQIGLPPACTTSAISGTDDGILLLVAQSAMAAGSRHHAMLLCYPLAHPAIMATLPRCHG
eukprot:COSAG02_NODE_6869_length_3316_cov_2.984147_3_plen_75_part_00